MKENEYSIKFCKNFGINILTMLLCAFSTLQGVPLEADENTSEEIPLLAVNLSEEIASFDINSLVQQPVTAKEIPSSSPILDFHPAKNSFIAVGLSSLMPGFGHVYLGDAKTAGSLIGVTGLSACGATFLNSKKNSFLILQNTWSYGIYAAYRDVRSYNQQSGYSYKMPMDSYEDLAGAPFSLKILKKPGVWGGF
jgi:hypothetical protein